MDTPVVWFAGVGVAVCIILSFTDVLPSVDGPNTENMLAKRHKLTNIVKLFFIFILSYLVFYSISIVADLCLALM